MDPWQARATERAEEQVAAVWLTLIEDDHPDSSGGLRVQRLLLEGAGAALN